MSNMPDTSLAHLTTVALNVKLFAILKSLRKRESRAHKEKSWIPRIKCGAGSAGVYPDQNRGRNDKLFRRFIWCIFSKG